MKKILQQSSLPLLFFSFTFHLAFPSPPNFSFHAVTESFSGYLNSFILSFQMRTGMSFTHHSWSEANQAATAPPGTLQQHCLTCRSSSICYRDNPIWPGQDGNGDKPQFHSNTLLSSLQRAELTLMSLSCLHRTLRKSLASLQSLFYRSGTSELMFHKAATKLEGKLPC